MKNTKKDPIRALRPLFLRVFIALRAMSKTYAFSVMPYLDSFDDLGDEVDRRATGQRQALLDAQVGLVLRRLDEVVARRDRPP